MLSIVILDICLISIEAEVGFTQDSDTIHPTSLTKTGRYNNPSNNEVDIQLVRVTMLQALKDWDTPQHDIRSHSNRIMAISHRANSQRHLMTLECKPKATKHQAI